jgi:hypothetical protein
MNHEARQLAHKNAAALQAELVSPETLLNEKSAFALIRPARLLNIYRRSERRTARAIANIGCIAGSNQVTGKS